MQRVQIAASLCAAIMLLLTGCAATMTAEEFNAEGGRFYKNGQTYQAIKVYTEALKDYPNDTRLLVNRGAAYEKSKEYQKALDDYHRAIKINPALTIAYMQIGSVQFTLGKKKEAMEAFRLFTKHAKGREAADGLVAQALLLVTNENLSDAKQLCHAAIAIAPDQKLIYSTLADIAVREKNWPEAIKQFSMVLRIDPSFIDSRVKRGLMYWYEKDFSNALNDLNRAISEDPSQGDSYFSRGQVLASMEKYEEALSDLNRAIQLSPSATKFKSRAKCHQKLKRYKDAFYDFHRCLELNKKDSEAWAELGAMMQAIGKFREAAHYYGSALEIGTKDLAVACRYSNVLFELGEYDRIMDTLQRALNIDPKLACAYGNMAKAQAETGARAAAAHTLRIGINACPDSAELMLRYSVLLAKSGDLLGAIQYSGQAASMSPDSFDMVFNHCNVLSALKRYDEAVACTYNAISINPKNPNSYALLSNCYSNQGKITQAQKAWKQHLDLQP